MTRLYLLPLFSAVAVNGLSPNVENRNCVSDTLQTTISSERGSSRRNFFATVIGAPSVAFLLANGADPQPANAIGPVKVDIINPVYSARPCPPDKPIPGEKAMQGMRGLCVTVDAEFTEPAPKDLSKVGIYGYVNAGDTGESVLANNPDGGTDAGQFAMVETITKDQEKISFEFIAAIPREKPIGRYENGIGPLDFSSLRIISFPGGQQFGAISPCEMNEFSDECEAWEEENGPYKKGDYMMKSNERTKGR